MNIVFMGTPEFSVPSLKMLIQNYNVLAVFTQPDKPKGRGHKLAFSEVKEVAVAHNIPVYQPVRIRKEPEVIEELRRMNPDYIIVVAFGQILPKEVLDIPKYGCINLHASLLPKYRGAAPLNWCIVKGEKESGNTTMLMDVGLDTGDMLLKSKVDINENMTAGELHDILMKDGAELLRNTIEGIVTGEITPEKQDDSMSCYAPILTKETGRINWNMEAKEIHNQVRGLNPWPLAFTNYNDKVVKIYKTEVEEGTSNKAPGTILEVSKNGLKVASGKDCIIIKELQFPNGKPLRVEEYLKGNLIDKNIILQ